VAIRRQRHYRSRVNYSDMESSHGYNEVPSNFSENGRNCQHDWTLSDKQLLQIALHWLGTGGQYHSVGDKHGVSKASVCRAVLEVVAAVNRIMLPQWVLWPRNMTELVHKFHDLGRVS
jgi:hypothetical protein